MMDASQRRRAFSMLELMLVLAIIGALMAVAAWNFAGTGDRAKRRTTVASMSVIESALGTYYLEYSGYPPALSSLVTANFLDGRKMKDGWNAEFIYQTPGQNNRPYDLFSAGPDKQFPSADDIDIWTALEEANK